MPTDMTAPSVPGVTINILALFADTVMLCSIDSITITWFEAEPCYMIAVKECLCPFSLCSAYSNNVYAPTTE